MKNTQLLWIVLMLGALTMVQVKGMPVLLLDQPVTLIGKLGLGTVLSENAAKSPIRYPVILLDQPISVADVDGQIKSVQLAMNGEQMQAFRQLKGNKASVYCAYLYEWDNGNHHTPVLCFVETIVVE